MAEPFLGEIRLMSFVFAYRPAPSNLVPMAPQALAPAGGDAPHDNRMPSLALNFCIARQGSFPPRG